MTDKPNREKIAEQLRAFAQEPRMQELKRQLEALQHNQPESIRTVREQLKSFSERLRMQFGQRGQAGVEPPRPEKLRRGRPKGAQYPSDARIIRQMRDEMARTGETQVDPVAMRFATKAEGGGTVKSKATRLAKAYRAKF